MSRIVIALVLVAGSSTGAVFAEDSDAARVVGLLEDRCLGCHSDEAPSSGIGLGGLLEQASYANSFRLWQRVERQLRAEAMPPEDAEPLTRGERRFLLETIEREIAAAARRHDGEPGRAVMRRLTSSEYEYTINDLTGLDLPLRRGFVDDAVGGTGFTNAGTGQFVQGSTLRHYLDSARRVAGHAVIGSGPLTFHADPGRPGFELSAITRIRAIYREHGFRSASGEGGEAFGLDRYPRAMFAAWRYENRGKEEAERALSQIAEEEGVDAAFVAHVHRVMKTERASFPLSEVVNRWQQLPQLDPDDEVRSRRVREECDEIAGVLRKWQRRFGSNPDAKEEAPVLSADHFGPERTQPFEMNVNWPEGTRTAHLVLATEPASGVGKPDAVVIWREPRILFRIADAIEREPEPLSRYIGRDAIATLGVGRHPRGGEVGDGDFVTTGYDPVEFEIPVPPGARSARLLVTAELDTKTGESCIVRCTITQREETDQGKAVSGLLADPSDASFREWRSGVLEFARLLPHVSHGEPAPSDRDPIPAPFDATYNNPERNEFHTRVKYHRDDRFLVEHILDEETRRDLDRAWADLLGSFDYHDQWLRLLAENQGFDLGGRTMATLDEDWIASLPPEPREHVRRLHREYRAVHEAFAEAAPGHIDDVLEFAARAWRHPLSGSERARLRDWYVRLRTEREQMHPEAIRALLERVLVAPEFLYRAEAGDGRVAPLSDWELASRLSYLLWSSAPDERLRRLAAEGRLSETATLVEESRRMLRDPRSERFAAEFFGQWFGFYRFDEHRGVDLERFPEFDEDLRASLHREAVAFFDDIVRNDRPVDEILTADHTFLDRRLAAHYGVDDASTRDDEGMYRVIGHGRGGLLRLGAVLTVTSAPLRTSPVKRGDWVLRRVLGTPVPPPPADAGSIAADDVRPDGLTVRDRLEAHRTDAACRNCHSRIDPLGFALETFDPLGRSRETYRDGQRIDASGTLRDGTEIAGYSDLREYLRSRRSDFHATLSTKLLAYALGRTESVGDLPLLERMNDHLNRDGGLRGLVELVVTSRQFRYRGGPTESDEPPPARLP